MFNKSLIICSLVVLLFGCKTAMNNKLDNKSERGIKGQWMLNSVQYKGSDYIKVTSFHVADSKCFEGSQWNFVSNNNEGNFQMTKCQRYTSKIVWTVTKDNYFNFKFINEGMKAKHVASGYKLLLTNQTDTSFQLIDKVQVAGKLTDVTYNFIKVN